MKKLLFTVALVFITILIPSLLESSDYISPMPILTEKERRIFAEIKNPPQRLIESNGQYNIGLYNGPIKNVSGLELNLPEIINFENLRNLRLKRWEYHSISNQDFILTFFVVNTGYVGQLSCYLYDKKKQEKYEISEESLLALKTTYEYSPNGDRTIQFEAGNNSARMNFKFNEKVYHIDLNLFLSNKFGKSENLIVKILMKNFFVDSPELSLFFPFDSHHHAYTHKTAPLKIVEGGRFVFGGNDFSSLLSVSVATTDYTHSCELRRTTWKWANMASILPDGKKVNFFYYFYFLLFFIFLFFIFLFFYFLFFYFFIFYFLFENFSC